MVLARFRLWILQPEAANELASGSGTLCHEYPVPRWVTLRSCPRHAWLPACTTPVTYGTPAPHRHAGVLAALLMTQLWRIASQGELKSGSILTAHSLAADPTLVYRALFTT